MCDLALPRAGDEPEKRTEILNRLFHGGMDMSKPTWIEPPFTADYVSASLPRKLEQDPAHIMWYAIRPFTQSL